MYFHPKVIYRDATEERKNSIVRYIGNRVLRNNKNFLCALTGQTGVGKSWLGLAMAEMYSKMFNIPFDPKVHVIFSLKELLQLITGKDADKKIRFGSVLVFDEPQIEANARSWQSEANNILNQLISTFRNQRLVVFFATPSMSFIDKQSRILFHGEFKVLGFDRNTGITRVKPRFLEWNQNSEMFYKKRLIIQHAVVNKEVHNTQKLSIWNVERASQDTLDVYEEKKKRFTDNLNRILLNKIKIQEFQESGRNKSDDLLKIQKLYEKYGEDYIQISKEMPHITPLSLEKLVLLVKRTAKAMMNRSAST